MNEPQADEWSGINSLLDRLRDTGLMVDRPIAPVPSRPEQEEEREREERRERRERKEDAPSVEWDVAPQSNVLVPVRCPGCGIDQHWPGDVTRLRCHVCKHSWRWAICERCGELRRPPEQQEVWRCSKCGNYTRAWWRTATAARDAVAVVARRQQLLAAAQRESAATVRRRRLRLAAVALVVSVAIGALAAVAVLGGDSGPVTGAEETCRQFARLRSDLGSGTLDAADLAARLASLQAASAGADPSVVSAVAELAAVGRPSDAGFLVAQTKLADACTAAAG